MQQRSAEVVIIGAGISGGLIASRLATAGVKVLVLEAGPRVNRDDAVELYRRAAIKVPECAYPNTPYAPHPASDAPDAYYVQDGPALFGSTYLRQVGGTTWHWLGTVFRFVPDDFRLKTRFGVGVDWPIRYEDLETWYGQAERELGVSGDSAADLGSRRSGPYPLPPIPLSHLDQRFKAVLAAEGIRVDGTPQARNSQANDGRPACCGSASCIPICPVQAKYDATVHLGRAERAGAELLEQAVVASLEADASGRITTAVVKRPDGSVERVTGKVFVLAAHGIESPKLLLQSRSSQYPAGLANRSDQVGRNLMDHPTQQTSGMSGEPVWPYRGPLSTSGVETGRAGTWRATRPAYRIQIDNQGWGWARGAPESTARELIAQGLRGEALDRTLAEQTARQVALACMVEQLPLAENRVVPDFDRPDALGLPRPRITYRLDDYVQRGLAEGRRTNERILRALKSTDIVHNEVIQAAGHIIGTCRMGTNPREAVVDADLRAHDHANLFIVGSSVFPTSAASNPTLTIAALALRAAGPIERAVRG